ncbi:MAG: rhomboid family intramembrane serine protease [Blastopirellula sp. JB062]
MIIPYSTDAPLYHPPIATTTLIVINVLLLFLWPVHIPEHTYVPPAVWDDLEQAHDSGEIDDDQWNEIVALTGGPTQPTESSHDYDWRTLHYGDGIKPWQWLTGNFMHADFWHLLGNMIILWPFGALIEGKIGWQRFLLLFAGIGIFQSAIEQFIFLFNDVPSFSLGASAVIFGLIAIALVWAPMNEVSCIFLLGFRPLAFTLPISVYCAFSIVIEMLILYFTFSPTEGNLISSAFFHVFGACLGLAVGTVMVRQKWVDCENYDFYTVYFGNPDAPPENPKVTPAMEAAQGRATQLSLRQIRQIIEEGGDPAMAYRAHLKLGHSNAQWHLPEDDLLNIIQSYLKQKRSADALPAMVEYVRRGGARQNQVRIRLAHVMIDVESRPGQALRVLDKVEPHKLNAQDRQRYETLRKLAEKRKAAGEIEPAAEDI